METREWSAGAIAALSDYAETATDAARNSYEAFSKTFRSLEDELTGMFTTLKFNFESLLTQIQSDIVRMAVRQQITGPLAAGMGLGMGGQGFLFNYGQGSTDTGFWGKIGGFLSNLFGFGGFRAEGGNVEPRKWYVVGENRQPEIFIPHQPGIVVPLIPDRRSGGIERSGQRQSNPIVPLDTLDSRNRPAITDLPKPNPIARPFGGFRAEGGSVEPRKWYVVGERRQPEIFIPREVLARTSIEPAKPVVSNDAKPPSFPRIDVNVHIASPVTERVARRSARQVAAETYGAVLDAWGRTG